MNTPFPSVHWTAGPDIPYPIFHWTIYASFVGFIYLFFIFYKAGFAGVAGFISGMREDPFGDPFVEWKNSGFQLRLLKLFAIFLLIYPIDRLSGLSAIQILPVWFFQGHGVTGFYDLGTLLHQSFRTTDEAIRYGASFSFLLGLVFSFGLFMKSLSLIDSVFFSVFESVGTSVTWGFGWVRSFVWRIRTRGGF